MYSVEFIFEFWQVAALAVCTYVNVNCQSSIRQTQIKIKLQEKQLPHKEIFTPKILYQRLLLYLLFKHVAGTYYTVFTVVECTHGAFRQPVYLHLVEC